MRKINLKIIILASIFVICLCVGYQLTNIQRSYDTKFDWKIYTNNQYQYKIEYPKDWLINSTDPSNVFFSSPETIRYANSGPKNIQNYDVSIHVYKSNIPDPVVWKSQKIFLEDIGLTEMVSIAGEVGFDSFLIFRKDQNEYLVTYPTTGIQMHMVRSFVPGL